MNQGDDIEVPIIRITRDWTVDEIETEEDCDDAHAVLTALICSIEAHMDEMEIDGREVSHEYKRAKTALRWKKAAMAAVNTKRGAIKREIAKQERQSKDRNLLQYIANHHYPVLQEALEAVSMGYRAED